MYAKCVEIFSAHGKRDNVIQFFYSHSIRMWSHDSRFIRRAFVVICIVIRWLNAFYTCTVPECLFLVLVFYFSHSKNVPMPIACIWIEFMYCSPMRLLHKSKNQSNAKSINENTDGIVLGSERNQRLYRTKKLCTQRRRSKKAVILQNNSQIDNLAVVERLNRKSVNALTRWTERSK